MDTSAIDFYINRKYKISNIETKHAKIHRTIETSEECTPKLKILLVVILTECFERVWGNINMRRIYIT